jgi:diguanylate cyclase (GGDEF)-like protein/PAS domain S-box-containing protein
MAAEPHLLDAVPVALQVWTLRDGVLTCTWANEAALRLAAPEDVGALEAACRAQAPAVLGPVQITPLGADSILAAYTAAERPEPQILSGLLEGVLVIGTDGRVTVANEAAAELIGVPSAELTGLPLGEVPVDLLDERGHLLAVDQMPLMRALRGEQVRAMLVRFVRRDGSLLWVEVHARPLHDRDGNRHGAVATFDDVTARVEQERRTRQEADTDALTGLANRRALDRALAAALGRAAARSRAVGVIVLDLDGFKAINDKLGHAAGDAALREVARRLRRCVRERDVVARFGGDEFVVVLTDVEDGSTAVADSVARIRAALAEPFDVALRAAVGSARFPADGTTAVELLAHADRAMYAEKGTLR